MKGKRTQQQLNSITTMDDTNWPGRSSIDGDLEAIVATCEEPMGEASLRSALDQLQLTASQLINISVKELNRRLANFAPSLVSKLKHCRRTLKNRGYAKSCRIKRLEAKTRLEQLNRKLAMENRELDARNRSLQEQLDRCLCTDRYETGPKSINHHHHHQQQQQHTRPTSYGEASYATNTGTGTNQQLREDTCGSYQLDLDYIAQVMVEEETLNFGPADIQQQQHLNQHNHLQQQRQLF